MSNYGDGSQSLHPSSSGDENPELAFYDPDEPGQNQSLHPSVYSQPAQPDVLDSAISPAPVERARPPDYDTSFGNPLLYTGAAQKLFAPEVQAAQRVQAQQSAWDTQTARTQQVAAAKSVQQAAWDRQAEAAQGLKAVNDAARTDFRMRGAKFEKDSNGYLVPSLDEDGKPMFSERTWPLQYDPNGTPYVKKRDSMGNVTTANPDDKSPIGPHDEDMGNLYRQNKLGPWTPLGTVQDGLTSPDQNIREAAKDAQSQINTKLSGALEKGVQDAKGSMEDEQTAKQVAFDAAQTRVTAINKEIEGDPDNKVPGLTKTAAETEGGIGIFGVNIGSHSTDEAKLAQDTLAKRNAELEELQKVPDPDHKDQKAAFAKQKNQLTLDAGTFKGQIARAGGDVQTAAEQRRQALVTAGKDPAADPILRSIDAASAKMGLKPPADQAKLKQDAALRADPDFAPVMAQSDAFDQEKADKQKQISDRSAQWDSQIAPLRSQIDSGQAQLQDLQTQQQPFNDALDKMLPGDGPIQDRLNQASPADLQKAQPILAKLSALKEQETQSTAALSPVIDQHDTLVSQRRQELGYTDDQGNAVPGSLTGPIQQDLQAKQDALSKQAQQITARRQAQSDQTKATQLDIAKHRITDVSTQLSDLAGRGTLTSDEQSKMQDLEAERKALSAYLGGNPAAFNAWASNQPKTPQDAESSAKALIAARDDPAASFWASHFNWFKGGIGADAHSRSDAAEIQDQRKIDAAVSNGSPLSAVGAFSKGLWDQLAAMGPMVQGQRSKDIQAVQDRDAAFNLIGNKSDPKEVAQIMTKSDGYRAQLESNTPIVKPDPNYNSIVSSFTVARGAVRGQVTLGQAQSYLDQLKAGAASASIQAGTNAAENALPFIHAGDIKINENDTDQIAQRAALTTAIDQELGQHHGAAQLIGGAIGNIAGWELPGRLGGGISKVAKGLDVAEASAKVAQGSDAVSAADKIASLQKSVDHIATATSIATLSISDAAKNPGNMSLFERIANAAIGAVVLTAATKFGGSVENAIGSKLTGDGPVAKYISDLGPVAKGSAKYVAGSIGSGVGMISMGAVQDTLSGKNPADMSLAQLGMNFATGFAMRLRHGVSEYRSDRDSTKARDTGIDALTAESQAAKTAFSPDHFPDGFDLLTKQESDLRDQLSKANGVAAQDPIKNRLLANLIDQHTAIHTGEIPPEVMQPIRDAQYSRATSAAANMSDDARQALAPITPEGSDPQDLAKGVAKIARGQPMDALTAAEQEAVTSPSPADGTPAVDEKTQGKNPVITQPAIDALKGSIPEFQDLIRKDEADHRQDLFNAPKPTDENDEKEPSGDAKDKGPEDDEKPQIDLSSPSMAGPVRPLTDPENKRALLLSRTLQGESVPQPLADRFAHGFVSSQGAEDPYREQRDTIRAAFKAHGGMLTTTDGLNPDFEKANTSLARGLHYADQAHTGALFRSAVDDNYQKAVTSLSGEGLEIKEGSLQSRQLREAVLKMTPAIQRLQHAFDTMDWTGKSLNSAGAASPAAGRINLSVADMLTPANAKEIFADGDRASKIVEEEAIHAVMQRVLSNDEAANIWKQLPRDLQKHVQETYLHPTQTKEDWRMGHEFLRMYVQHKLDGRITEQSSPSLMRTIQDALGKVLDYFTGMIRNMRRAGVHPDAIHHIENVSDLVAERIRKISSDAERSDPFLRAYVAQTTGLSRDRARTVEVRKASDSAGGAIDRTASEDPGSVRTDEVPQRSAAGSPESPGERAGRTEPELTPEERQSGLNDETALMSRPAITRDDLKDWPGDEVTREPDGTPKTFYHGSKNADELSRTGKFDASKADPKSLYGPGFYFTDDPKTAGGDGETKMGYSTYTGGVVPAHLDVRHPFDIDADMDGEKWQKLIAAAHEADPRYDWDYLSEKLEQQENEWNIDGKTVYVGLAKIHDEDGKPLGKAGANELLKKIGYDGITHIGGANTYNDPHRVVIAFDPHQIVGKFGGIERKAEDQSLFSRASAGEDTDTKGLTSDGENSTVQHARPASSQEGDFRPEGERTPLESAAHDTLGDAGAGPEERTSVRERRERVSAEEIRLRSWAEANGKLGGKLPREDARGGEHIVQIPGEGDRVQRVFKATRQADQHLGYGLGYGDFDQGATPGEYLDRMAEQNRVFGDDVKLERVVPQPGNRLAIVTSQPFMKGEDAPVDKISEYMARKGFEDIGSNHYYNSAEGLLAYDLKPANAKIDAEGNIHPIDPVIQRAKPDLAAFLKNNIGRSLMARPAADPNQQHFDFGVNSQPGELPLEGKDATSEPEKPQAAKEDEDARAFKDGDNPNEKFSRNLGLAYHIADRFLENMPASDRDDVRSRARQALLRAARAHDPEKGPFGPYAAMAIKNELRTMYAQQSRYADRFPTTLDAPAGADSEETKGTLTEDESQNTTQSVASDEAKRVLDDLISKLPDNLRPVAEGIRDGKTLEQIGESLGGMTKQGVANRAMIAMTKLRQQLAAQGIKTTSDLLSRPAKEQSPHAAMAELERIARGEKPGARTIGRPDLALGAHDPLIMSVDEWRKGYLKPETHEDWEKQAQKIFNDPVQRDKARAQIISKGLAGEIPSAQDTKLAMKIVAHDSRLLANNPTNVGRRNDLHLLVNSYRQSRTEAARTMAAGKDPLMSPADRHREFLSQSVFTTPPKVRDAIDAATTPEERQKIITEDSKRLAKVQGALKREGMPIEDILGGKPEDLTPKEKAINDDLVKSVDGPEKTAADLIRQRRPLSEIKEKTGLSGEQIAAVRQKVYDYARRQFQAGKLSTGEDLKSRPLDPAQSAAFEATMRRLGWAQPPNGFDLNNLEHVFRAARTISGVQSGKMDMLQEARMNTLLSGPLTLASKVISDALHSAYHFTAKRGMESLINMMVGRKDAAGFGEFKYLLPGLCGRISEAARMSAAAWRTENDMTEQHYLNEPVSVKQFEHMKGQAIPGTTGRIIRAPSRSILAADSFAKSAIAQTEAAMQAHRMAKALVNAPGYSGPGQQAEWNTLMQPGSPAWQKAIEVAKELTFQQALKPLTGPNGNKEQIPIAAQLEAMIKVLADHRSDNRLLMAVLPFVKTPFNIERVGIRNSPLGAASLIYKTGGGLVKMRNGKAFVDAWSGDGGRMVRDFSEQALAWPIAALLWHAVQGDDDDDKKKVLFTGSTPRNLPGKEGNSPGLRELQQRAYGGDYILRVGGRNGWSFNFSRAEPFATVLGATVDSIRALKMGVPNADKMNALWSYFVAQAQSKTFIQGFSDFTKSLDNTTGVTDIVKKAAIQALVPNILRQPLRNIDDYVRDNQDGGAKYLAAPSASNAPQRLDVYGHPMGKTGNAFSRLFLPSGIKPSEQLTRADQMLLHWNTQNPAAQYAPQVPNRHYRDGKQTKEMTGPQYHEFLKIAGQKVTAALSGRIGSHQIEHPKPEDIDMIKHAFEGAHREAKTEIESHLAVRNAFAE